MTLPKCSNYLVLTNLVPAERHKLSTDTADYLLPRPFIPEGEQQKQQHSLQDACDAKQYPARRRLRKGKSLQIGGLYSCISTLRVTSGLVSALRFTDGTGPADSFPFCLPGSAEPLCLVAAGR